MPERCRGEYVKHRSPTYPNCTADATFRLDWKWAQSGVRAESWYSFACPHHLSQVIRWVLSQEGVTSPVTVKNYPSV